MTSLAAWLFASSTFPTGTLVWSTGGAGTAIVLTGLLLVTVGAIAWNRERPHEQSKPQAGSAGRPQQPAVVDSRLPSAA